MMGLLMGLLVAAMVEVSFLSFFFCCGWWWRVDVEVEVSFCCDFFFFLFFVSGGYGMGGGFLVGGW